MSNKAFLYGLCAAIGCQLLHAIETIDQGDVFVISTPSNLEELPVSEQYRVVEGFFQSAPSEDRSVSALVMLGALQFKFAQLKAEGKSLFASSSLQNLEANEESGSNPTNSQGSTLYDSNDFFSSDAYKELSIEREKAGIRNTNAYSDNLIAKARKANAEAALIEAQVLQFKQKNNLE